MGCGRLKASCFRYYNNNVTVCNQAEPMIDNSEPCPSCGRPTPIDMRCIYCATVTDLDLKSLKAEYLKSSDDDESAATLAAIKAKVAVVVGKSGQRFPLRTSKVRIGRDATSHVAILDDTFASRHHAWISFEEGSFWLVDLGSTNGTLLNGHPVVKRQLLSHGDKIRVGHTELTFEMENAARSA